MTADSAPNWLDLSIEAGKVFTPNTPINQRTLFAGRIDQIRRIADAVNQTGQHAILFGERGVGKTSLANVIGEFQMVGTGNQSVIAPRINCDGSDDFDSVWRKIFQQIEYIESRRTVGFDGTSVHARTDATDLVGDAIITPEAVRRILVGVSHGATAILIVDEFDRLKPDARRAFGDVIKTLSDHAVPATVVVVGVADSIDDLIEGHQSVSRAMVQIQMPRMAPNEIEEIVTTGLTRLGMTIDKDAKARTVLLSQGLPHYTHLVTLHAVRAAIDARTRRVSMTSVNTAISKSIGGAQHTIRQAYHEAIASPQRGNLFADVLLSCSLAKQNELGEFGAPDVREMLRQVTGKDYDIPSFAQHLKEFSDMKRGNILKKIGQTRRFRYRFSDPLMRPYVIMQGLATGRVSDAALPAT